MLTLILDIDHSTNTGNGYFMQADLSKRQNNDKAQFKTPIIYGPQCMTFYYHMFGHGGTFNLYMADGNNLGPILWTRSGSQGDVWRFSRLSITRSSANVVFEGSSAVYLFSIFLM